MISVDDDGAGLAEPSSGGGCRRAGSGTALANIRLRLRQTYGSDASLRRGPVPPHGVRAALSLPLAT